MISYEHEGTTIYHGDCLEIMPTIAGGSVDLILCDLPYGTTACKWDSVIPFAPLWACYKRLIKKGGAIVLTAAQPFTTALIASNMEQFKYCWVWDKKQTTGFLNAKKQPLRRTEDVCVFSDGQSTYNPTMDSRGITRQKGGLTNRPQTDSYGKYHPTVNFSDEYYPTNLLVIPHPRIEAGHPTQKPVALMEYLIRTYANEGETVLDNTMGSGTTGVACIRTGRKFIGIEKEEEYFCTARTRIADAQYHPAEGSAKRLAQKTLF